ncbi:U-box domain-containing protein 52-like isoform X1 [Capsicum annuum]|uniref:U-box domain-containing protein 52-like isoform X1 n=1 Tax=Capsicum annuum TaxID=4072 RepID=UPI0007BF10C8|nr:U-box domain-containing protein 52-like isoform X1 [Capsicum annuum]
MWPSPVNMQGERMPLPNKLVAVAIDKDKGSQIALKWTVDHLLARGQTVLLIHVKLKQSANASGQSSTCLDLDYPMEYLLSSTDTESNQLSDEGGSGNIEMDQQTRDLFLPFRVFCTRKDIQCYDVVLDDTDVAKAVVEYVNRTGVEILVVGATTKGGLLRFKAKDIPGGMLKGAPDFCTVHIISKSGKISSTRAASRPAPFVHPLRHQLMQTASTKFSFESSTPSSATSRNSFPGAAKPVFDPPPSTIQSDTMSIKSPFTHRKGPNGKPYELSLPDTDISYVSSGRPSVDNIYASLSDSYESGAPTPPRLSGFSDFDTQSFDSTQFGRRSVDTLTPPELSIASIEGDRTSFSQGPGDDLEAEMRRLKQELSKTMEMYSTACKEALTAKQKAMELQRWKMEEKRRLEEARLAEEAALAIAEREKARSRAAIEHAEASQRLAELEAQKRISAEMKAIKEAEEKNKILNKLSNSDSRYRKYTIEEIESATDYFAQSRKIGEGGYGPVYKCYLDHTPVAVKVLRPDATHGRQQFQQEIEVLSCIRHPNMVLLLGACPEYGCLVYEFMSNGSLDDRLFHRGKTPPLSWQQRFRIAAEIATGVLFLHQSKPEPLVHRDLKPGNILLDRNFVSKISDVGLARLVPPSVADTVTQYRMTSTAGTFCYIDPEYQQTGMLGVKSDVYSLGIIFLQILTARSPMGLTHYVERAIEKGTFHEMLDPAIRDWPLDEAMCLANLSLQCSELRRKDRPDLGKVVLPELERLRTLAEENTCPSLMYNLNISPNHSQVSLSRDNLSYPNTMPSSYESSKSQ